MTIDDFSAYDYVDQPVFVLGPDESNRPVYCYLNAAALRHLDQPLENLRGLPAYQVFSGRAAYSVYRRQCLVWARGEAAHYEIALPVGSATLWVRTRMVPVHDGAGNLTHMVGTSQDITPERNQLQAHAMATAAAREMEDLMCFAAHDLRTPIGNLKSLAYLLREDFVDHGDGKSELIDMIDTISDKALSVVSDIMGHVMATTTQSTMELVDLGAICDDIMVMLDPTRAHSVAYPRQHIHVDGMVVHITLRNLIDNAIKHCGRAASKVAVDVTQMNAERLLFTVRDDGGGFSEDAFANDVFKSESSGSGFGLNGVQRLVRSRGGQLAVMRSATEAGAEVHFELPGRLVSEDVDDSQPLRTA